MKWLLIFYFCCEALFIPKAKAASDCGGLFLNGAEILIADIMIRQEAIRHIIYGDLTYEKGKLAGKSFGQAVPVVESGLHTFKGLREFLRVRRKSQAPIENVCDTPKNANTKKYFDQVEKSVRVARQPTYTSVVYGNGVGLVSFPQEAISYARYRVLSDERAKMTEAGEDLKREKLMFHRTLFPDSPLIEEDLKGWISRVLVQNQKYWQGQNGASGYERFVGWVSWQGAGGHVRKFKMAVVLDLESRSVKTAFPIVTEAQTKTTVGEIYTIGLGMALGKNHSFISDRERLEWAMDIKHQIGEIEPWQLNSILDRKSRQALVQLAAQDVSPEEAYQIILRVFLKHARRIPREKKREYLRIISLLQEQETL